MFETAAAAITTSSTPIIKDRSGTIWATRLEREMKSLAALKERSENNEISSILPPHVTIMEHSLNINEGTCKVTFRVEVETPSDDVDDVTSNTPTNNNDVVIDMPDSDQADNDSSKQTATAEEGDIELSAKDNDNDVESAKGSTTPPTTTQSNNASSETFTPPSNIAPTGTNPTTEGPSFVTVEINASIIPDTPHSSEESSHNNYPFQKPRAFLTDGASLFRPSGIIKDGDLIDIDCDWTPSLHLVDAALNVVLRIRESVRRGDPSGINVAWDVL
mmetsp:Transcript_16885/g.21074  ORF Transcript_16885/g.21074 Transcript_16885/m.21074 type:complete len:275 (+) Transcript_16885:122-946(+)|eukprot:CAMPEP_0172514078 /NCGR_PEP_ID=MMETSP1066-20121228/257383_1 /TAXON_ID=671091 /ORGANISM="Coscinodiscus wailesii, Strain CCMP2513" /LENGTH=274 /DNA_ID=CAMNT_0013294601 /DNA_START=117 /DNA_END=941 /DNA_ORIENTATION=+